MPFLSGPGCRVMMSICVLRGDRLTIRLRPRFAGSTSPAWPLWSRERDRGRPTIGRRPPAATGIEPTPCVTCAVTAWYHSWLDRALAGDASPPFYPDEFVTRNQTGVDDRQGLIGPGEVAEFQREALSYLDRAKPNWNRAYGFPLGTVTVGLHVGVAATEWHLHAWDLTSTEPEPHSPEDSAALFRAAGAAVAEAEGGIQGRLTALLVPIAARRSSWQSMLKRSDRDPNNALLD